MKKGWNAGLLSGGRRGVEAPSGQEDGPVGSSPDWDETPADVMMTSAGHSPRKDETPAGTLQRLAGNSLSLDAAPQCCQDTAMGCAPLGDVPGRTSMGKERDGKYDMGSVVESTRGHEDEAEAVLSPRDKANASSK